MMDELGHTWVVDGKNVTPMYDEDVYELIRENICDDCANYVKGRFDAELSDLLAGKDDDYFIEEAICGGECRKVQETQEHYENLLKDIRGMASKIYHTIVNDWTPGSKRTKKEQFAVDTANDIIRTVNSNT